MFSFENVLFMIIVVGFGFAMIEVAIRKSFKQGMPIELLYVLACFVGSMVLANGVGTVILAEYYPKMSVFEVYKSLPFDITALLGGLIAGVMVWSRTK